MTLTTNMLASFLGKPAAGLRAIPPFRDWRLQRSVETDLDKLVIGYVFPQEGMDFVCDGADTVTTIFAYNDSIRCFQEGLGDVPFEMTRQQVIDRFGRPAKSGERFSDPILGECGAWDRFDNTNYTVHVEYHLDSKSIKKITIMREDVVP